MTVQSEGLLVGDSAAEDAFFDRRSSQIMIVSNVVGNRMRWYLPFFD